MLTKGQCMSHDHPEVGWQSRARLRRESSDSGLGFRPPQPFTHHSERQMETAPTRNPRGKTAAHRREAHRGGASGGGSAGSAGPRVPAPARHSDHSPPRDWGGILFPGEEGRHARVRRRKGEGASAAAHPLPRGALRAVERGPRRRPLASPPPWGATGPAYVPLSPAREGSTWGGRRAARFRWRRPWRGQPRGEARTRGGLSGGLERPRTAPGRRDARPPRGGGRVRPAPPT